MAEFKTGNGRPVTHQHSEVFLSAQTVEAAREWLERNFPNVRVIRSASCRYNCHGFAFAQRHAWFSSVDRFLADDYRLVNMSEARIGDILIYTLNGERTHSAVVTEVDEGEIIEVRSKWGAQAEVFHSPLDVPRREGEDYGRPAFLYRLRTEFGPFAAIAREAVMKDETARREAITQAMEKFTDPDIYFRLLLASSPEMTRRIIESLPGVKELIDAGPEAGQAALELFERTETQENHLLSTVALYLLQRLPTKEAARPIARFMRSEQVACFDNTLAAEAFLASTNIEIEDEDPVSVAFRESEKFL